MTSATAAARAGLTWLGALVVVLGWMFSSYGCHATSKGAELSCELDYVLSFWSWILSCKYPHLLEVYTFRGYYPHFVYIFVLREYYLHFVEISTFRGYYPHFVYISIFCGYYPHFVEISSFCRYYSYFICSVSNPVLSARSHRESSTALQNSHCKNPTLILRG